MTILLVIVILVLLIVVHELGHFLVAKFFRVRVEEFGIGYPPRALMLGKVGDTEYTLNWLPLGGFVRLFGEEDDSRQARSFSASSHGVQAAILIAGVIMNVFAGWLLYAGAFSAGLARTVSESEVPEDARLVITRVVSGSPGHTAGLKPGDIVTGVSDEDGRDAERTPQGITAFVSERGGENIFISYVRGKEQGVVVIRPAHAVVPEEEGRPAIGLGLALVTDEPLPLSEALREAYVRTITSLKVVFFGVSTLIAGVFTGEASLQDIVGPVGLVEVVGDASKHGLGTTLAIAAFISINLAVVNMIPIPALDGGRLFLLGIEVLTRRRVHHLVVQFLNFSGIVAIGFLMLVVTYNDITRLLI